MSSVAALIALIVIGLLGAALLKVALGRRVEVGREERRLQAACLADSGVDRAVSRLMTSAEYAGETWEIAAEDLGGRGAASVAIEVGPIADRSTRRKVRVRADYPVGSSLRARQSREIVVVVEPSPR